MKNKFMYLTALFLTIVAVMLVGCKKNNVVEVRELDPESDWEILEAIAVSDDEGVLFPDGSTVRIDHNGTHHITLPEGFFYLVAPIDARTTPVETPVIGVNCRCNEGSGCDPVTYEGKYYCIMKSGCLNCTRTDILENHRGETIEVEILGLLNRNVGITLLCDKHVSLPDEDDIILKPYIAGVEVIHGNAFDALFDVEDVKEEFCMWAQWFEEQGTPPNTLAFTNIFGNVALIPFYIEEGQWIYGYGDEEYFAKTIPPNVGGSASYLCNCQSGTDGCTLDKKWIPGLGTAYRCISNGCPSCTLLSVKQN